MDKYTAVINSAVQRKLKTSIKRFWNKNVEILLSTNWSWKFVGKFPLITKWQVQ